METLRVAFLFSGMQLLHNLYKLGYDFDMKQLRLDYRDVLASKNKNANDRRK